MRHEPAKLTVVPANQASMADIETVFTGGDQGNCQCQFFKVRDFQWKSLTRDDRRARLREQTGSGHPEAAATSGLIGYLGAEPVGWVAVEPRVNYPRLPWVRTVWAGRDEDKDDDGVWAVTCLIVRKEHRRRGFTYPLAAATAPFALARGAKAIEAYPMITEPGKEIIWNELYRGSRKVFAEAGFTEVSRPSKRRVVMRIDFLSLSAPLCPTSRVVVGNLTTLCCCQVSNHHMQLINGRSEAGGAVDCFADDVRMTVMPRCLLVHVQHDRPQVD